MSHHYVLIILGLFTVDVISGFVHRIWTALQDGLEVLIWSCSGCSWMLRKRIESPKGINHLTSSDPSSCHKCGIYVWFGKNRIFL